MTNKRGFSFSFGWMFALIAGAIIIILSLYAVTKMVKTEKEIQNTEIGKGIEIILNPIGTVIEEGKSASIILKKKTRLFNNCYENEGDYGVEEIKVATSSGIGNEWEGEGVESRFKNKYLFSEEVIEGKKFFAFSKPLEMPFKIGNLIYLWSESESYCFIDPPRILEKDLEEMNDSKRIYINNCPRKTKTVCFRNSGCDIDVSLSGRENLEGSVGRKFSSKRVHFEGLSLLYGAIFSEEKIYECNLKRLMNRGSKLAETYILKSLYLNEIGCNSGLETELENYKRQSSLFNDSIDLISIKEISEDMKKKNEALKCEIFKK